MCIRDSLRCADLDALTLLDHVHKVGSLHKALQDVYKRQVRELAPRSVQVLEDSGLLEKAFCKMNTAVVQSAPELLVVADPQWVSLDVYKRQAMYETRTK